MNKRKIQRRQRRHGKISYTIGLPNNVMQNMDWTDTDYLIIECDMQNNAVLLRADSTFPKCAAPAIDDKTSVSTTVGSATILEALIDILSRPLLESSTQTKVQPTSKLTKKNATDVISSVANLVHSSKIQPVKNAISSKNTWINGKVADDKKKINCKTISDEKYTNDNKDGGGRSSPSNSPTNTQESPPYRNLVDISVGRYVEDSDTSSYSVTVHGDEDEQGGDQQNNDNNDSSATSVVRN